MRFYPYVKTEGHAIQIQNMLVMPQDFSTVQNQPCVIEMEQTAEFSVEVTDDNDNPIQGAVVGFGPNFSFPPGPGGIVGTYFRSADSIGQSVEQLRTRYQMQLAQYVVMTDELGVALIKNLPALSNASFQCTHKDFEMPPAEFGNPYLRYTQVDLTPGETSAIKLRLQPKGDQVLGK